MKEVLEILSGCREKGITVSIDDTGGHLRVKGNVDQLSASERALMQQYKQEILSMLRKAQEKDDQIQPAPVQDGYPLSPAQKRLWIIDQLNEGKAAYNVYLVKRFEGRLNLHLLNTAFAILIERHEILRTVFKQDATGGVKQYVIAAGAGKFSIDYVDMGPTSPVQEPVVVLVQGTINRPFDLEHGPLLSATLFHIDNNAYVFSLVMHHIITDGLSMDIFINELLIVYKALAKGGAQVFEPLPIQYRDYAVWQQQQLETDLLQQQKHYWLRQLAGNRQPLDLPADHLRPPVRTYRGNSVLKNIDAALASRLRTVCRDGEATLFMGLLALVNVLLYRYTRQQDIVVGIPVAGRGRLELEHQIGCFINTLAIRTGIDGSLGFSDVLKAVRQVTMDAYDHQHFPFDEVVDALQLPQDSSRNALFDVMVALESNETDHAEALQALENLVIRNYSGTALDGITKFDWVFNFVEQGEELQLEISYNRDIYEHTTILRLAGHLEQLLQSALANTSLPIRQLTYLTEEEQQQLLVSFNDTAKAYPVQETIVHLFEEAVRQYAAAPALVVDDRTYSYAVLNERANQLAGWLNAKYMIKPEEIVAIRLPRNEWFVVAILGILKAGAAYLPIDMGYPNERIDQVLKDSQCRIVIDAMEMEAFEQVMDQFSSQNGALKRQPEQLAYVIYTSGSTGIPKGVMIGNRSLVNLCYWHINRFGIAATDRATWYAGVSFDASVWELFPYIISGACLYIVPGSIRLDVAELAAYYETNKITVSFLPTQIGEQFLSAENNSLRYLLLGGDRLTVCKKKHYKVINNYGPTENTVVATSYEVDGFEETIPIGRPIDNVHVYILDEWLGLCATGVAGEIYLGGSGLAHGYINSPALTDEKFITNPFDTATRLYNTGDWGKWLPDGTISFLGRKDGQVKVRGHRIELGEVEAAFYGCAGVEQVAVVAKANWQGENELIAFFTGEANAVVDNIRTFLLNRLPAYMVPVSFVQLDALPLTLNGKIDKKALQDLSIQGVQTGMAYVAPRNEMEEKLVRIWQEVLGIQQISVKDNFFHLGGHSLNAYRLVTYVQGSLGIKMQLKAVFEKPILEDQATLLQQAHTAAYVAIPPAPLQPAYPLSSAQQRIWLLSQFENAGEAYNIPGVHVFEGPVNVAAIAYAFTVLINRHEILRTVFIEDGQGTLQQVIAPPGATQFSLTFRDLQGEKEPIEGLVKREIQRSFDLSVAPLLVAALFQTHANRYLFTYTMHHIISDGWSMGVLIKELLALYEAYISGHNIDLPPLGIQYKDYAVWQRQQLETPAMARHKSWWLQQFQGELPLFDLPADRPRPAVKTYNCGVVTRDITASQYIALQSLVANRHCTLFMGLLALVKVLLYRYTGQEDMIIGTPVAGRDHIDLENQIGLYINTLALRTRIAAQNSFIDTLDAVKQTAVGAYEHAAYPFDELVNELGLARDTSRNALFDVMLTFQNEVSDPAKVYHAFKPFHIKEWEPDQYLSSKFDLGFDFWQQNGWLKARIKYNTALYDFDTIDRLAGHLMNLLAAIVIDPSMPIGRLPLLAEEEKNELLIRFNNTGFNYPEHTTILPLLEAQMKKTPDSVAVVADGTTITYRQLDRLSNKLALYLQEKYHAQPEDLIGIRLPRNEWMIIALLGILKCGAAYVPIDMDYPAERVNFILNDSRCIVLIDEEALNTFRAIAAGLPDGAIAAECKPGNAAYVIYTSGSTGQPKGVVVTHKSMLNYLLGIQHKHALDLDFIFSSSICFDASLKQTFLPLLNGKKVYVYNLAQGFAELPEYIREHRITVFNATPSAVKKLIELPDAAGMFTSLSLLIVGGEPLDKSLLQKLREMKPGIRVINAYGPTETCANSITGEVQDTEALITIGTPVPNTRIYIVNAHDQLAPIGVRGEICIAGHGLAREYLNNPAMTNEKFVANPFEPGERLYRTGDVGRWLPDGRIECFGRNDDQVKIRGYRIEPGEIEAVLQTHASIDAALVVVKAGAQEEKLLVAYILATKEVDLADVTAYIGARLPAYMVPAHIIQLGSFPLTTNGKIDKKLLPEPQGPALHTLHQYIAPHTEIEIKLAAIWQEVLGLEKIGIKDNFFELGGHSLKAGQVIARINNAFSIRINIQTLFREPTIEHIAMQIGFLLEQQKHNRENLVQIEL